MIEAMLPNCLLLLFRAYIPLVDVPPPPHDHTLHHRSINVYFEEISEAVKRQTGSRQHVFCAGVHYFSGYSCAVIGVNSSV